MTIFGKPLSEYFSFAKVALLLVAIVGIVRLGMSLAGVDNAMVKWLSVSVAAWLALIYFAVRVQTASFGSYETYDEPGVHVSGGRLEELSLVLVG